MKKVILIVFIFAVLWVAITSIAYSFINPSKTQTETFLHIPQSIILNFHEATP